MHLFINLFHAAIHTKPQKCDEEKVEEWIKNIVKDAHYREEDSHKKVNESIF